MTPEALGVTPSTGRVQKRRPMRSYAMVRLGATSQKDERARLRVRGSRLRRPLARPSLIVLMTTAAVLCSGALEGQERGEHRLEACRTYGLTPPAFRSDGSHRPGRRQHPPVEAAYGASRVARGPWADQPHNQMNSFVGLVTSLEQQERGPVLRGAHFFGEDHVIGTQEDVVGALVRLGADPRQIHIAGKIHSQRLGPARILRQMGANVYWADSLEGQERTEEALAAAAVDIIRQGDRHAPVLIMGDGGGVLSCVSRHFAEAAARGNPLPSNRVVGIEKTQGGYDRLQQELRRNATCPIAWRPTDEVRPFFHTILVGADGDKKVYESPAIVLGTTNIVRGTAERLNREGRLSGNPRTLVVGAGPIGTLSHEILARTGHVSALYCPLLGCLDGPPGLRGIAPSQRPPHLPREILEWAPELVLLATGHEVLNLRSIRDFSEGTVFGNLASLATVGRDLFRDVESRTLWRMGTEAESYSGKNPHTRTLRYHPLDPGKPYEADFSVRGDGRRHTLLNSLYPLNFGYDYPAPPPIYIQGTRGMMVLAAIAGRRLANTSERTLTPQFLTVSGERLVYGSSPRREAPIFPDLAQRQARLFIEINEELLGKGLGPLTAPTF